MKNISYRFGILAVAVLTLVPSITPVSRLLSKISPAGNAIVADGSPLPPPVPGGGSGKPPATA